MFKHKQLLAGLFIASFLAGCAGMMGGEKYQPLVVEQKSIPQVSVKVSYKEVGIYQVQVESDVPETISLLWDSSAYLNTSGDTIRLLHMESMDDFPQDTTQLQIPSVIRRGERFRTFFVGESWIDFSRRGVTPRPKDTASTAKIYLAFEMQGKKIYWKGEVSFAPQQ